MCFLFRIKNYVNKTSTYRDDQKTRFRKSKMYSGQGVTKKALRKSRFSAVFHRWLKAQQFFKRISSWHTKISCWFAFWCDFFSLFFSIFLSLAIFVYSPLVSFCSHSLALVQLIVHVRCAAQLDALLPVVVSPFSLVLSKPRSSPLLCPCKKMTQFVQEIESILLYS